MTGNAAGSIREVWQRLLQFYVDSYIVHIYRKLLTFTFYALLYAPLGVMWLALLLGSIAWFRILAAPELVVKAIVGMLNSVPQYAMWSTDCMLQQLYREIFGN